MSNEPTETQKVLASMLCENTGQHMLDSGGAYGRHWERNQGITVEDFINAPDMKVDKYGVYIDIFYYLSESLEYDKELDDKFQEWMMEDERSEETYFTCVYEWCEMHGRSDYQPSFLTYNEENLLSQDFQADCFVYEPEDDEGNGYGEETYVCLSIHGGCDIRGGYTKPRIFKIDVEFFGDCLDSFTVSSCDDRKGDKVTVDYRHGDYCHVEYENAWPDRDKVKEIDPKAWCDIWDTLEWDDETNSFWCPDKDGHVEFYPPYLGC